MTEVTAVETGSITVEAVDTGSITVQAVCEGSITVSVVVGGNETVHIGIPGLPGPRGEAGGTIPPIAWAFGDAPGTVWIAPADGTVSNVKIAVNVALNGTAPTIEVGTLATPGLLMEAGDSSALDAGEYETTPDVHIAAGTAIRLTITPDGSTAGSGALYLTFLPD